MVNAMRAILPPPQSIWNKIVTMTVAVGAGWWGWWNFSPQLVTFSIAFGWAHVFSGNTLNVRFYVPSFVRQLWFMVSNVRSPAPQKIFTCEWKSSSFCNYLSAPPRFSFFFFSFSSAYVLFAHLLHHFFLVPAENLSDAACNCLVTHAPTKNCPYFFLTFCSFYFMFLFLLLPPPYHPLPSASLPPLFSSTFAKAFCYEFFLAFKLSNVSFSPCCKAKYVCIYFW